MPSSDDRLLLASIHDVAPCFEGQIDRLVDLLENRLGHARFAMLVVPDHWGRSPISETRAFQTRLRGWAEKGIEMFLHGWSHRDDALQEGHHGAMAGIKARHMTAGEGEFLGLSHQEASRRMLYGKALLEDVVGVPVAGFIAPAWLYGAGAMSALEDCGFALAEDHFRVWKPGEKASPLARGPVITWASRSTMRTASSLAFAALARHALQPLEVVRLAVHPGDVTKSSILDSVDRTLVAFTRNRKAGRYRDLLEKNSPI